jgi:outer membrane protein TolC
MHGLAAFSLALVIAFFSPSLAANSEIRLSSTGAAAAPSPGAPSVDEPAPAEPSGPPPVKLPLSEVIRMAVEGNLDIRVARVEPEQSRQNEIAARAFFDTSSFGSVQKNKENQEPTNFLGTSSSEFDSYILGLNQEFVSGANATLSFSNSRSDLTAVFPIDFNPSYSSNLSLSFTQPLLRGVGAQSERNSIRIARNNLAVSESELRDTVMGTVREVTDAYWDLAASIAGLRVAKESLELAENLLELNKAKVEVGTLAPIEITQAEAGVASREEAVIVAENLIRTSEDNLRRILNAPRDSDIWMLPLEPADEPRFEVHELDMDTEVATALEKRPDLEQQRLSLHNLELQALTDRNSMRPQLDLTGSYGLSGIAGDQRFTKLLADLDNDGTLEKCDTRDPLCGAIGTIDPDGDATPNIQGVKFLDEGISDAWEQLTDKELVSWGVGLNFSMPIRNRAAKARYARSKIAVDQARVALLNAERRVEIEVRNAVRQVQTNVKRVQAARVSVELEREKLDAEEKRFQYGMTTSFQVLEFQTDLTESQASLIRAFLDYEKSLAALADATGTLLEKHDIEVQ